jgi:RIO kinase 1
MNTTQILKRYLDYEKYEEYEALYRGGRSRERQNNNRNVVEWQERVAQLAESDDSVHHFLPSYVAPLDPRHYERQWIIDSLGPFYQENIITDVTRLVKAGKEANVYCCVAHEGAAVPLIAAKLYRPRKLRTLKNDAIYKEGRVVRDSEGKEVRGSREARAMRKKTRFGQQVETVAWIGNEFQIQSQLYQAGADVPRPISHGGNTVLMAYLGDEVMPAPVLSDVTLETEEAQPLFERIMRNVELMLTHHYVHGDLSSYNILYWDGRVTLIDFPQVVDARVNGNAFMLLERDVKRVCDYFGRFGVTANPVVLAVDLWERYMRAELG